jgi:streptogramin lyase
VAIILMTALLLLSAGAAFAFAEETTGGPTAPFLPSEVDSAAALAPLTAGSEPVSLEAETNPSAAEALPHTNLNRTEAEELLEGVFGTDEVEAPAEFFDELDIEVFRSDYAAVVAPAEPGADPGLLTSTLPLRAASDSGEKVPVDLDLKVSEGVLKPANSLVQVEIPLQLSEGISLPDADVTVELRGGAVERNASELGNASAFYPNVATDTDFVVAAVPTGFETYTHLRSPEAPTQQKFNLDVPAGAELRETSSGGAEVMRPDGSIALSVSAPSAVDAEGSEVPVTLAVDGSSIVLSTDPGGDVTYPILVDPIFDTYNLTTTTNPGTAGAGWVGSYRGKQFSPSWDSPNYGMNALAVAGPSVSGSNAWFDYYVPRYWSDIQAGLPMPTTYIRDMKLWNLSYIMPNETETPTQYRPASPFMQMGLWSATKNQFAAYGERFGYEGQWTDGSYVFDLQNPNENTDVKNGGFGIATWDSYNIVNRHVSVQRASIELTDQDSPVFGSIGSPSGSWMNATAIGKIPYIVSDVGLGIYSLKLKQPRASGGFEVITVANNCVGNSQSPCPRKTESGTRAITYAPQSMAQGENFVEITAVDPVNHVSSPSFARIKVDHSAPELSLSGNLTQQGAIGVNLSEYTLDYGVRDGDDAPAEALPPIGITAGQLQRPMGVDVDAAGNVWTVDRVGNRIVKYDASGKFLGQFGAPGAADGQLSDPRGIAISPTGNVWVAEVGNKRLQLFKPSGEFIRKITLSGSLPQDPKFVEPYDLAVGPNETLWVADLGANKVFRFREDGTYLGAQSGMPLGMPVKTPSGIDVDAFGNAWVAEQGSDKILEFDPSGKYLFSFGATGSADGQMNDPNGLAVAPSGNIFVLDANNNRVQEFKPDGSLLRKFGSLGAGSAEFVEARGLAVGAGNIAYVADAGNQRIARWSHADQDPQSGAAKVEIKVDGSSAKLQAPGCSSKNCSIGGSWTLDADDYAAGSHKVEVIATDGVNNSTTKTLQIETHGDRTSPSVALWGTMTEQATLGTTRPSYRLGVEATDPGSAEERTSGVVATTIKVDGQVVDSSSPGCPGEGCSIKREWTLNADSYTVGPHSVEVTAIDGAGRSTTKTLAINIARDTTAPELNLFGMFYTAAKGWLEQKSYSYNASATDSDGYGVVSMTLKIDGNVIRNVSQTCPAGGCGKLFGFSSTINMANYSGGAHPAELIAVDGAGNVRKRSWTINVDPEGHISTSEAEDTLEALDATSPVNTVGLPASEPAYEGTAAGLEFQQEGELLVAPGSAAPTAVSTDTPGEIEVKVPTPTSNVACAAREAEDSEEPRTGEEEEQLANTAGCEETPVIPSEADMLTPVSVTPVSGVSGEPPTVTPNSAAAVAENVAPNVDLVTRPLFDGAMTFTAIRDVSAAESFSWRVQLDEDQTMTLKGSKLVEVAYESGHVAFTVAAIPAHDAIGTTVPTRLSVEGNVLTLHVEHKSGSFIYPVVGGAGWEGGFQTYQVVMPPSTEGSSEEEGEVTEGESPDEGIYREATFGPPLSATGPVPLKANPYQGKKRRYNFHDCRFDVNGGVQEPPIGGSGGGNGVVRRAAIHKCHGETSGPYGEYFTLKWAVSIHGHYEYERHNQFVWINKWPDCDKWGGDQPAKLGCRPESGGVGTLNYPNLDLFGFFRFAPGRFGIGEGAGNPVCYRLNGVLPSYWFYDEGAKVLESTFHTAKEWRDIGEPCAWNSLSKIQ